MSDNDTEVEILFSVITRVDYSWVGPLSDLPVKVRKGIWTGRGENRELDADQLSSNLDDDHAILEKLAKSADEQETEVEVEIQEVNEA